MDLVMRSLNGTPSTIPPPPPPQPHSSDASFPIIAITMIGIISTGFLLASYYIFVNKCCLNWHRIDILQRFSTSRNQNHDDPLMIETTRGLNESVIRSIPIFKFRKQVSKLALGEMSFCECAVCLNEFQEEERLKRLPNCSHVFHIDCIDIWLQNNANCPLCRTSISGTSRLLSLDHIIAPSSSPQVQAFSNDITSNSSGSEGNVIEDYVVIELGNYSNTLSRKKYNKVGSKGDECINIRGKDNEFGIEPIRRSFSMGSSTDRKLFLAVQDIVHQRRRVTEASSPVNNKCLYYVLV